MVEGIRLYRHLAAAQLRAQMQYKVSFLLTALAVFLATFIDFAALLILLDRFGAIGGWRLPEVALLFATVNLPFGLIHLTAEGFEEFRAIVRDGNFDRLLIRPRTAFLQVLGSAFPLRQLGRLANALLVLALALHWLDAPASWSLADWLILGATMLGGVFFFMGIVLLSATICFWTVDSIELANIATYGGTEMASYPMHVFGRWMRRFFSYVVPLAFVNYHPLRLLLGKADPHGAPLWFAYIALPVCLATLTVGLAAWRVGVRHYRSTGS